MADGDGQGREALASITHNGLTLYYLTPEELKAHDAEVAAAAFDEGARAAGGYGHEDGWTHNMNPFLDNPYRADESNPR